MPDALRSWMFLVRLSALRGLGLVSGGAVLASAIFAMTIRGAPWRGDLLWTIDWLSVGFVICGPLIAGSVALDIGRMTAGSLHQEGRWPWKSPGLGIAIGHASLACAAQLIGLAAALLISLPPVPDPFAWLAVTVQLLLLILFVSIGALVGRLTQPVLAGLVASSAVLLLVYFFGAPSKQLAILHTGLATLPRIGYHYNWAYLAAQAVIVGAIITGTWLIRPTTPVTSKSVGWTRWVAGGLIVVVAVGAGMASTVPRLLATGRPPTHCGAVETLQVCYFPEHARVEASFSQALWVIVDSTRLSDYKDLLPQGFAETSRTWSPTEPGTASFTIGDEQLTGSPPDVAAILRGIVEPVHCAQLQTDAPPSERYGEDLQRLVGTWLEVVTGSADSPATAALSPAEALELRDQFATCSYPYFTRS